MNSRRKHHLAVLMPVIVFVFLCLTSTGCISVSNDSQLSPNASQSVVLMRRASSSEERNKAMEIFIDGRVQSQKIKNGEHGQTLIMNGLRNIYVKIGKHQSQTLTFNAQSEVIEFLVNFEETRSSSMLSILPGFGSKTHLNLTKVSGGDINTANTGSETNVSASPTIILNLDASSTTTVNTGDDNSIR